MQKQSNSDFLGHPKGLFLLFSSELWERFSFYAMRSILVLYLTDVTMNGGLGWSKSDALQLYGIYTGLIYITPILGGWLADNYLGQRKSIILGAILMALAQFTLSLPNGYFSDSGNIGLYLGLGLLICGNGMFKPNISTMVGDLYALNDTRRDSAFTIFYMGINIGSFFSGIIAGTVTAMYSFKAAFFVAGIGMLIALGIQFFLANRYLGDIGKVPSAKIHKRSLDEPKRALTKAEIDHIKVILILGFFTIMFWAGFEQAGGLINLYTADYTDRTIGDYTIPTAYFQSLNPMFIILLAPVFAWFWAKLGKKDPSFVTKFVFALLFLAIGFVFMMGAVIQADLSPIQKASMLWLIGAYLFHTVGELCLSPIGLSMVSKLAPTRYSSLMMGVWFGFSALANFIAGMVGSMFENYGAYAIFSGICIVSLIGAVVLWLISDKLLVWIHEQ